MVQMCQNEQKRSVEATTCRICSVGFCQGFGIEGGMQDSIEKMHLRWRQQLQPLVHTSTRGCIMIHCHVREPVFDSLIHCHASGCIMIIL
jgi:hypothetical protein